jgi:hypothetical protein
MSVTERYDFPGMAMYGVYNKPNGLNWVGYDNPRSLKNKVRLLF